MATLCYFCGDTGSVLARSVGPEGVGPPQDISAQGETGYPQVAVDSAARATVAWSSSLGVRAATRGLGGAWSSPVTVAPGADPVIAVSPSGVAELVWRGDDGVVRSSRRAGPDAAWQSPVVVSVGAGSNGSPIDVAIDPGDKAVVAWTGADGRVRAAVRPAGAGWTAQVISPAGGSLPQVAANPAGTTFAVFSGPSGAPLVSVRPAGGVWSDALPLGAAGASGVQVAADGNGNAVAAWTSATGLLQSSTYDGTGPVVPAPAVTPRALVGQPVTASAAPWDLWSSVGLVVWDFGDGTTGAGSSVTHAYGNPGAYTITVRATDALGNGTSRATQTVIAPPPRDDSTTVPRIVVPGTSGVVGSVFVGLPGAARGSTPGPSPLSPAAARRLPPLKIAFSVPKSLRVGTRSILTMKLNRFLRSALVRVQLRRGVTYKTVAQGRVSGRRVPIALSFKVSGRYLLRVQIREAGRANVNRVTQLVVRR